MPLLDGKPALRARAAVDDIAAALRAIPVEDPSLAGGAVGWSLFFAYLAEVTGREDDALTAVDLLEGALAQDPGASASLFEGRTGVAWTLAHLEARLLDLGGDDPNSGMDEAVLSLVEGPASARYDLISGLVGLGVYALERLPRPSTRLVLERIVDQLAARSEQADDGVRWFTPASQLTPEVRRLSPDGHWDLGMAHGAAGVVAFLGHARAAGVACDGLLDGATSWLRGQPSQHGYGAWTTPTGHVRPARTAWCYGDPGVAAALLAAGRKSDALDIALAAASRPAAAGGVVDAGLCHGAAGLLHVYNRLYQTTGDERLAAVARRWLEAALDLPVSEAGFLEGRAGVGLALLAATTDVEPAWDRILLLSGATEGRS